ncbi:hypothetical protein UB45_15060 [Terrabacter sp. 28]|nr:hypothetical protein UB45_15060 [Terrabacter sp. 28]
MGILRGLLGGRAGRRDDPAPVSAAAEVGHRVFVEQPVATVWQHLVAPPASTELGVDCVRVLSLPGRVAGDLPEFVGVWRRRNGRLWAGLSTVVELEEGRRVVTRSADGTSARTLTTTLEPLEEGCVVAQQLCGPLPGDAASFARAWLVRALLGLKADLDGRDRDALVDAESDELVERVARYGVLGPGVVAPAPGAVAPAVGATAPPGFTPVSETATIDLTVPPERLWEVLGEPSSEQLVKPDTEHLVRVGLADEPAREHVVGVHRHAGGRRGVTVSLVVEAVQPSRIVERELTASHESDVVTTIEALGEGSRLTETVTGWLPSGPGRVVDSSAVAAFMQTRLDVIKNLAEGGARPQRDARTGFLPPGQTEGPTAVATHAASVPSSVVLPPPHVPDPGEAYDYGPRFFLGDSVFYLGEGVG